MEKVIRNDPDLMLTLSFKRSAVTFSVMSLTLDLPQSPNLLEKESWD